MTSNTNSTSARYQLDISAEQAADLDKKGRESAEKRGETFTPEQNQTFISAPERIMPNSAGQSSINKRKHVTEQIAEEYVKK
ncbi:uncharacterized protein N7518_002632 [Penicillium psychrosexuale]|uniref:uncharacterized protein n=1 Tax=Penicillium psychrosexuale TaxID=1002107 RepID=UPI00254516E2|nr:uncharacterized protein N7518_002632 [Penicillium psychrosexuale]KAJ5800564.1 hypothetical protein N7518_002632 [Penicillium psychrosexuale]